MIHVEASFFFIGQVNHIKYFCKPKGSTRFDSHSGPDVFSRSIRTFFFCPYKILVAVVKKFGSYPDDYHIHKNIADKLDPLNFSRVIKTVYSKSLTVLR